MRLLASLPTLLRGIVVALLLGLSTLVHASLMVPPALLKLVLPPGRARSACDHALNALASRWVALNNAWIEAVRPDARWDVQGVDALHARGWYLVSSNHRSWVDILVLQRVFHGRIPFLKFFLKAELIWVPVIGLAWWALDFPFLRRGKGQGARSNDLATTRAACEKFRHIPTSVINFVEGTRFTPAKHAQQASPYRHLLKPKIGGLGVALATMGEQFEAMLDVTIAYPHGTPSFWQLISGQVDAVSVRVQTHVIPSDLVGADPLADRDVRRRLGTWIEGLWAQKDDQLESLLNTAP
ncbi:MAG: acyltransferase [Burkholderiaceae bacterium]|nr:acyltransferase [Burkholderiaceae bacterium]